MKKYTFLIRWWAIILFLLFPAVMIYLSAYWGSEAWGRIGVYAVFYLFVPAYVLCYSLSASTQSTLELSYFGKRTALPMRVFLFGMSLLMIFFLSLRFVLDMNFVLREEIPVKTGIIVEIHDAGLFGGVFKYQRISIRDDDSTEEYVSLFGRKIDLGDGVSFYYLPQTKLLLKMNSVE